ncbi:MAG: hypothetical protein C4303_04390 [candidate division GAL15 bacterium]
MALRVRDILGFPELQGVRPVGEVGLDQPVRWVHTWPEVLPWLHGGELLLTTAYSWPPDPDEQRRIVRDLARAGVAAILFRTGGEFFPEAPPAVVEEAVRAGLGILEATQDVSFVDLTETINRAIIRSHFESLERSERIHQGAHPGGVGGGHPGGHRAQAGVPAGPQGPCGGRPREIASRGCGVVWPGVRRSPVVRGRGVLGPPARRQPPGTPGRAHGHGGTCRAHPAGRSRRVAPGCGRAGRRARVLGHGAAPAAPAGGGQGPQHLRGSGAPGAACGGPRPKGAGAAFRL